MEVALTTYLASGPISQADADAHTIAAHHGVLPLYLDWVGVVVLDRVGHLAFVPWEESARLDPLTERDRHIVLPARVRGGERFPAIAGLKPQWREDCRPCPTCQGTGRLTVDGKPVPDNVMCACANLGWLPPLGQETR